MPRPEPFVPPALPPATAWRPLLDAALGEDLGTAGDVTSALVFDAAATARARIEVRAGLRLCGMALAQAVFQRVDARLEVSAHAQDGEDLAAGAVLLEVAGPTRSLLAAERTALNFLGRLCGVATHTLRFVEAIEGTRAEVVDTRKTLPGWRALDKYAAAVGGARNHRMGLFDGVLIKDNHVAAAGSLEAAVARALARAPRGLRVQVEVQSEDEARRACAAGADFLLLDNLAPDRVAKIVEACGERALLEASGGIGLCNVRAYAETGVHRISIGALTHSAPNADLALEIEGVDAAGGVTQ